MDERIWGGALHGDVCLRVLRCKGVLAWKTRLEIDTCLPKLVELATWVPGWMFFCSANRISILLV